MKLTSKTRQTEYAIKRVIETIPASKLLHCIVSALKNCLAVYLFLSIYICTIDHECRDN